MITLDEIPDAVEDWRTGQLPRRDLVAVLLDLLEHFEVDQVLERVPADVRSYFVETLRDDFDNDTRIDEILWIDSARGEHPAKRVIIERVRRWFAAHRVDRDAQR